ncbi:MAG TPA: glycosyltransferase family 4 protein [Candidatus Limnocylindria bacterium]
MTGPLRVVQLNDLAHTGETFVAGLPAEGIESVLFEPARHGVGARPPRKLLAAPLRVAALLDAVLRARRWAPDLVHLHYARMGWMARLVGRPYLIHCHGSDVRGVSPHSRTGRLMGRWMRDARRVAYATPDLEPWARAYRPDATFIPNPIPIPARNEAKPDTDLFVGVRFDAIKGASRVIETLRCLLELRPSTTITVVDQGRERARALEVLGGKAQVIGYVPHPALSATLGRHRTAMGQMAVGALGAYELEAMAAGLPVVASFRYPDAYPAAPPVIDAPTPAETAELLAGVLDDEDRRRRLADEGREWVAAHHGAEAIVHRVAQLYRDIMAEPR